MHSHHSHSGAFCSHAQAGTTPRSILGRASKLGFTTYHLSEHVPRPFSSHLYPEEIQAGITPDKLRQTFEDYLVEARMVQREVREGRFGNLSNTLVGAETENIVGGGGEGKEGRTASSLDHLVQVLHGGPGVDESDAAAIGKGRVDYLVGSVHHAKGVPIDFSPELFASACQACSGQDIGRENPLFSSTTPTPSSSSEDVPLLSYLRMTSAYLDAQHTVLCRLKPEVIGHFDLSRLFSPSNPFLLSDLSSSALLELSADERGALQDVDAKVKRNVAFAVSYGALFEVNSAAFRKGWETAYPGEGVLKLILGFEGRLCLSDDAHSHAQVGLNYKRAREYLVRLGVRRIWHLEAAAEPGRRGAAVVLQEERERERRMMLDKPGRGAPTVFARGCRAVPSDEGWSQAGFWEQLEERRIEVEREEAR